MYGYGSESSRGGEWSESIDASKVQEGAVEDN